MRQIEFHVDIDGGGAAYVPFFVVLRRKNCQQCIKMYIPAVRRAGINITNHHWQASATRSKFMALEAVQLNQCADGTNNSRARSMPSEYRAFENLPAVSAAWPMPDTSHKRAEAMCIERIFYPSSNGYRKPANQLNHTSVGSFPNTCQPMT